MQWKSVVTVTLLCGLIASGCRQAKPAPAREAVDPSETASTPEKQAAIYAALGVTPGGFLNKSFFVSSYEHFPFEVPAHARNPKLRGSFQTAINSRDPYDKSGNVDLLLMTEAEFKDYSQRRVDTAVSTWVNRRQENVDYDLSFTGDEPMKYELVFRGTTADYTTTRVVQANFSVTYEK